MIMKKLVQITDLHLYADEQMPLAWCPELNIYPNQLLRQVLTHLSTQSLDALLITGDLAEDATLATYQWLAQALQALNCPIYVIPGNHDDVNILQQGLQNSVAFSPSFFCDDWHIIMLDSSVEGQDAGCLSPATLRLLNQALDNHPDKPSLVFFHHHPVPIACPFMDQVPLKNADDLWQIVQQHPNVKRIYHGHIHREFAGYYQQLAVIGTPATSVQLGHQAGKFTYQPRSGWREIYLEDNGQCHDKVVYLDQL